MSIQPDYLELFLLLLQSPALDLSLQNMETGGVYHESCVLSTVRSNSDAVLVRCWKR